MQENILAFVCEVENYNGQKQYYRAFAADAKTAREKLIRQFPNCYVSEAICTYKEWFLKHKQK